MYIHKPDGVPEMNRNKKTVSPSSLSPENLDVSLCRRNMDRTHNYDGNKIAISPRKQSWHHKKFCFQEEHLYKLQIYNETSGKDKAFCSGPCPAGLWKFSKNGDSITYLGKTSFKCVFLLKCYSSINNRVLNKHGKSSNAHICVCVFFYRYEHVYLPLSRLK